MTRAEFEAALRRLREACEARTENERCVECHGCTACTDSTFCRGSRSLSRSHYCIDSERLTDCTHCRLSKDLSGCNHCVASERCRDSSYLYRSVGLIGCSYCFGCVDLVQKDFHILNRPYERRDYFALTARLARELGLA